VGGDPVNWVDLNGEFAQAAILGGATVLAVGATIYLQSHPDAVSNIASHFAKKSKKSKKARATDIPSWVNYQEPRRPGESCAEYAERVLKDQYGDCDQAKRRGAGSEYSEIKKNCERGK
jgi:hypothetical protein